MSISILASYGSMDDLPVPSAFLHQRSSISAENLRSIASSKTGEMIGNSYKWAYVRIITGTIAGGILGFYVMHRVEISYKEKMKERLRQYENELKKKEKMKGLEDSL